MKHGGSTSAHVTLTAVMVRHGVPQFSFDFFV